MPRRNTKRLERLASLPLISTTACSFSQMRGTAKNNVGWTSRRFVVTVSIDSAKLSTTPAPTMCHVENTRSATWQRGRYVTTRSLGPGGLLSGRRSGWLTSDEMTKETLALVSIAPLGGPVVPEVYTRVTTSFDCASAIRCSTAPGLAA